MLLPTAGPYFGKHEADLPLAVRLCAGRKVHALSAYRVERVAVEKASFVARRPLPNYQQRNYQPPSQRRSTDFILSTDLRPPSADYPYGLILGGADCVWDDVTNLEAMLGSTWPGIIAAVNDVGCHWPRRLDHWVTLHGSNLTRWVAARRSADLPACPNIWAGGRSRELTRTLPPGKWASGGSSGLLAVQILLHIGCSRIVLCGVPLTKTPHFVESKVHASGKNWPHADSHYRQWVKPEVRRFLLRVRSMSGRTRELLGPPDREWLQQVEEVAA